MGGVKEDTFGSNATVFEFVLIFYAAAVLFRNLGVDHTHYFPGTIKVSGRKQLRSPVVNND